MEIKLIVTGHVNELLGLNKDIKKTRMEICEQCPIFSPRLGGICNSGLYLNPETNDISLGPEEGYYKGCGCRLQAKTTNPEANCPAHKW